MSKKLSRNNGITQMDLIISVIIIVLFVSVIATLFYNVYIRGEAVKRTSEANSFIVEILETISGLSYDEVQLETEPSEVTLALENIGLHKNSVENSTYIGKISGYNITVKIQKYTELEQNKDKQDLEDIIKIITVTVKYMVGNNEEQIEISTVKTR